MSQHGEKGRGYRSSVWQDGIEVAAVTGADHDRVRGEITHYAMVYAQDGPVTIRGEDVASLFPSNTTGDSNG